MTLKWFDASDAENFGRSLAQFFIQKIPLHAGSKDGKEIVKQLEAVDQMYSKIEQFKLNNSLNIYKKAKLGSSFKYELIAAGYKSELVDQITKGLMLKL